MTDETVKSGQGIDILNIMELIPHRYPFLLIDRIIDFVPGEYIKAYKNVTINESFFQGHFPNQPVMPGVLMLEAMAQTSIVLAMKTLEHQNKDASKKLFVFTGIDKVRFRKQVIPGDKLEIVCNNPKNKLSMWKMHAECYVDGHLVTEADLTAAEIDKVDKK